jgi:hypothetical protein
MSRQTITCNNDEINIQVKSQDIDISLSRVGPQGAQGPVGVSTVEGLVGVEITDVQEGDILLNDGTNFVNHQLTTTSLSDVDNINRANGSIMVYNSSTQKYEATSQLQNPDTSIIGGSF